MKSPCDRDFEELDEDLAKEPVEPAIREGGVVTIRNFHGYLQADPTWCWAAVISSVSSYYHRRTGLADSFSQCHFVRRQHPGPACRWGYEMKGFRPIGEIDCRRNGCAVHDQPELGRARDALNTPGLSVVGKLVDGPVSFSHIVKEINRGRPLLIRKRNRNKSHHLLAVYGYNDRGPSLILWDPAFGTRVVSYNEMQVRLGRWTHTIHTHKPRICTAELEFM